MFAGTIKSKYVSTIAMIAVVFSTTMAMAAPSIPQHFSNCSILVVGDSMSVYLEQVLDEYFAHDSSVKYECLGKCSSGLAKPSFFNWEDTLATLAMRQRPDMVMIMLGTNDGQDMTNPTGARCKYGTSTWDAEYTRRVQRLLDICWQANPKARIFWIGAPVMGGERLNAKVEHINSVIRSLMEATPGCSYIDTWPTLADAKGVFSKYTTIDGKRVSIRADDGVHVTMNGARLLANRTLEAVNRHYLQSGTQVASAATPSYTLAQSKVPAPPAKTNTVARDILPAKAKEKETVAAVETVAAAEPLEPQAGNYSIMESSWKSEDKAKARVATLKERGIDAHVVTVDLGNKGIWNRVMIGSFVNLAGAKQYKATLTNSYDLGNTLIMKTT